MIGDSYIINISQRVQEGGSPGSGCPVNNQSDKVLLPHFIQKGSRGGGYVKQTFHSYKRLGREYLYVAVFWDFFLILFL